MKIAIISDTHFDNHKDRGKSFVDNLDSTNIDALIIAGDMSEQKYIDFPLDLLCDKYKNVIKISGNHSFWGSTKKQVEENNANRMLKHKNFHYLDNSIFELDGKRFLGTTLWFNEVPWIYTKNWADFKYIPEFRDWICDENIKSKNFLENNVKEGDVVITHHMPSELCIDDKYKGDLSNCFYVCNMEQLIEDKNPALWISGHTHTAYDFNIKKTRLICNPFGYLHEKNTGFNENLIVEL